MTFDLKSLNFHDVNKRILDIGGVREDEKSFSMLYRISVQQTEMRGNEVSNESRPKEGTASSSLDRSMRHAEQHPAYNVSNK